MTARPDDAQLDALVADAQATRSQALRFVPEVGGFRALTPAEDAELIDAIRLPEQRRADDHEHLAREHEAAVRAGDRDGAETAAAHLEVLAEERSRDLRSDPLWTRAELDGMDVSGLSDDQARAWEYLDATCELSDDRDQAEHVGDPEWCGEIEVERKAVDAAYLSHLQAMAAARADRQGPAMPAEVQDVRARVEGRWSMARNAPEVEDEERER